MPSILSQVSRELPLDVVDTYMKRGLLGSRLLQVYLRCVTNLLYTHDCYVVTKVMRLSKLYLPLLTA